MKDFWCDFCQWLQHEAALVQCGMGNGQARFVDYLVTEEKDVDVDEPRPFGLKTLASQGALDLQQTLQERLWRKIGFEQHNAVEEPGLIEKIDGLGFIERRNRADFPERAQASDGIAQICLAITEIGAEGKIRVSCFAFHVSPKTFV